MIIIILAIIVLIIVLIYYLKKPSEKANTGTGPGETPSDSSGPGSSDSSGGADGPAGAVDGPGGAGRAAAGASSGSGLLYIPPEMLGGQQDNQKVSENVESAIVGFDWEAGSGRSEFLYTYTINKPGWKCPCCEGENDNASGICMICGTKRPH